jgi:hypothetical protein
MRSDAQQIISRGLRVADAIVAGLDGFIASGRITALDQRYILALALATILSREDDDQERERMVAEMFDALTHLTHDLSRIDSEPAIDLRDLARGKMQ